MEEKMKYSTRQQKMILECLQEYGDTFYTIDQFMEILRGKEIQIGRTTVYRGLERLQKEGAVAITFSRPSSAKGCPTVFALESPYPVTPLTTRSVAARTAAAAIFPLSKFIF